MEINSYGKIRGLGWIIGTCIVGPVLLYLFNILFMGGNKIAIAYADKYIQNSDTIEIEIPHLNFLKLKHESFHTSLSRYGGGGNVKSYYTAIFYSKTYQRYLSLVRFSGYNFCRMTNLKGEIHTWDAELSRFDMIESRESNIVVLARVNRVQWNDPSYGTKENPIPFFWMCTLSDYNPEMGYVATISDEVNKIFVSEYLSRFLPEKEFVRLYGDDLGKQ